MNGKMFANMYPWGGRSEEWEYRLRQRHTSCRDRQDKENAGQEREELVSLDSEAQERHLGQSESKQQ